MSSAVINVPKVPGMDTSMFTNNRSKLLKLAEGIKTKKKPSHSSKKAVINFKKEPGYANIEHLVFGTYRPKNSPNNLNLNTENHVFNCPNDNLISVDANNVNLRLNGETPPTAKRRDFPSHGQQHILESRAEDRPSRFPVEVSAPRYDNEFADDGGAIFSQANSLTPTSPSQLSSELKSQNLHGTANNTIEHGNSFNHITEDPFSDTTSTTLCADLCSPRAKQKQLENSYHYQIEHPGIVKSKLETSAVHTPPVHLLTQPKFMTQEFSADAHIPDMPVVANKNPHSIKKLQIQGAVVTVAPSRLCSNTTQSSSRVKSSRAVTPAKTVQNSSNRSGETPKEVEKLNMTVLRDKISNSSASVRLNNSSRMTGAFKRLSPARSSTVGICNPRYSSPTRTINYDDTSSQNKPTDSTSTCASRRPSYLKSKKGANDESSTGTSSHPFKEPESRVVSPRVSEKFGTMLEPDVQQVTSKLTEVYSPSRLRKVSGIDSNAVTDEGENSNSLISEAFMTAHTIPPSQHNFVNFHNDKYDSPTPKLLSVVSVSSPVNNPPLLASVQTMPKVSISTTNPARPTVSTHVKLLVSKEAASKTNSNQVNKSDQGIKKSGTLRQRNVPKFPTQEQTRAPISSTRANATTVQKPPWGGEKQTSTASQAPTIKAPSTRPRTTTTPSPAVSNLMVRGRSSSSCSLSAGRKFGSTSSSLAGSQVSLCSTTNIRANVRGSVKNNEANIRRSFHVGAGPVSNRESVLSRPMSSMRSSLNNTSRTTVSKPPVCPPARIFDKPKANSVQNSNVSNRGKSPTVTNNNTKSGLLKSVPGKERRKMQNEVIKSPELEIEHLNVNQPSPNIEKSTLNAPVTNTEKDSSANELSLNKSYHYDLGLEVANCLNIKETEFDTCSAKATAESLDKLLADLASASETDLRLTDQNIHHNNTGNALSFEQDHSDKINQVPTRGLVTRRSISLPGSTVISPTHACNFTNVAGSLTTSPRRAPPARSISVAAPNYRHYNDQNFQPENGAKDFAIPHQEFSHSSPRANVSRRSSSCSDRTKEDLHIYQPNSLEINEILLVPQNKSWFLVDDNDIHKGTGDLQQVVEDLQVRVSLSNEQRTVRTSPQTTVDDVDVVSSTVNVSDTVTEQQKSGLKSTKERHVPKSVRRAKTASSPSFSDTRTDSWVSEGDLRRPWSQICSEQDVERLVQARSCGMGSGSMSTGIDSIVQLHPSTTDLVSDSGSTSAVSSAPSSSSGSSHGNSFGGRFASMRTPSTRPPGTSVEGVLQKFRKSFSARFYKKVKGESPPSPSNTSISARHASFSSYLNDHFETESLSTNGSIATLNSHEVINSEPGGTDSSTLFRLGPIVWRSSKEKKGKKIKKRSIGGDSSVDDRLEIIDHSNKDNVDSQTKLYSTNGSAVTLINHPHPNGYPPGIAVVSPRMFPRRAHSTSLRSERHKRPLSEQGSSFYGSANFSDVTKFTVANENGSQCSPMRSNRNGSLFQITSTTAGLPPRIVVRREKKVPVMRWSRERTNLRRSISQPVEIEKLSAIGSNHSPGGLSDQEDHDLSSTSSDEEIGSDCDCSRNYRNKMQRNGDFYVEYSEPVMYAEALWDHVTLDSEELPFKAGDLVEVLDKSDSEWWWGIMGNQAGWFPASFVRIRVNQEDTVEDRFAKIENGTICSANHKMSTSLLSVDQVRTKVIMEIFNTERDFVQHLKDVCEGYLKQVRKRHDMFSEERLNIIFGNVEQLYIFQSKFVSELEQCINWEKPHLSEIGSCFIQHRDGFEIYSEYCNNHPQAVNELQQLYAIPKYAHFFEACRLLQDMIDIALDGFLLTPVQKICKYPLQLGELLKYTKSDHPDYRNVEEALKTMRNVAQYINERKRRMECLEKLAAWQTEVEDWVGYDLLDHSSELIYSGDVYKVTTAWSRDFTLFLFDHQIIICKKDLLKRHSYSYKSRINVDNCEIIDIIDGKDVSTGLNLKNAWKVFCSERSKWYVFATRTSEEKSRWMKAFSDERQRVVEDRLHGFVVSEKAKKMATMVVHNKKKPKKPKDKENKNYNRRMSRPEAYALTSKSGSLPSNVAFNISKKKTTSGWFHFGSNKKTKR